MSRNLYLTVTSPEDAALHNKRRVEKRESTLDEDFEPKSCCSEPRLGPLRPPQLLGDSLRLGCDALKLAPRRNSDSSEAACYRGARKHVARVRGRLRNVNSLSPAPR